MNTIIPPTLQHGQETASPWVRRWSHLLPPGASVLDVACGTGRHVRWFSHRGHPVTGVDQSATALAALDDIGSCIERVEADIENNPWPLTVQGQPRSFGAVVVTNYLWRPLWPLLRQSVTPGGVLLYETFSVDHASIGRPARAEFLLRHGELLTLCAGMRIVAFEDGFQDDVQRFVQRIAAVQPSTRNTAAAPSRYPLHA